MALSLEHLLCNVNFNEQTHCGSIPYIIQICYEILTKLEQILSCCATVTLNECQGYYNWYQPVNLVVSIIPSDFKETVLQMCRVIFIYLFIVFFYHTKKLPSLKHQSGIIQWASSDLQLLTAYQILSKPIPNSVGWFVHICFTAPCGLESRSRPLCLQSKHWVHKFLSSY